LLAHASAVTESRTDFSSIRSRRRQKLRVSSKQAGRSHNQLP
jgi:hypothetical protein